MNENKVFNVLFQDYLSDTFDGLNPIGLDETEEIDTKFESLTDSFKISFEEGEELFDLMMERSRLCEKRGFICGIKLGAALMKEMEAGI